MKTSRALITLPLLLLALTLRAQQEPIAADRPGLADGSSTVGAGVAQIETGVTAQRDGETLFTLPTLVRYGIGENFELRVESEVFGYTSDASDLAPVAAGFKWRLHGGAVPLSIIAAVQPPSGGKSFGATAFESGARLVSDIDLGHGFSFTPNAGVIVAEGGGTTQVVAMTLARSIAFIDFEASRAEGDTSMIADAGIAWLAGNDTQLDVSAGVDVTGHAYPDWFVAAGISRRF